MAIYKKGRPSKYDPFGDNGSKPSNKAGEYRIRDDSGEVAYIGETCNLLRRMSEHKRSGKLAEGCSFEWQEADGRSTSKTRREHEREKIKKHEPRLNKSSGGEGRPKR